MAGSSKLHTEAAVIIPAEKPMVIRCKAKLCPAGKRKTAAEPRDVIAKIKPMPKTAQRPQLNMISTPLHYSDTIIRSRQHHRHFKIFTPTAYAVGVMLKTIILLIPYRCRF
jgi:hypothetical protein